MGAQYVESPLTIGSLVKMEMFVPLYRGSSELIIKCKVAVPDIAAKENCNYQCHR